MDIQNETFGGTYPFKPKYKTVFGKKLHYIDEGNPDAVLAALIDFPAAQERRWTDLKRLLEVGVELLDDARRSPRSIGTESTAHPARPQVMLLLGPWIS